MVAIDEKLAKFADMYNVKVLKSIIDKYISMTLKRENVDLWDDFSARLGLEDTAKRIFSLMKPGGVNRCSQVKVKKGWAGRRSVVLPRRSGAAMDSWKKAWSKFCRKNKDFASFIAILAGTSDLIPQHGRFEQILSLSPNIMITNSEDNYEDENESIDEENTVKADTAESEENYEDEKEPNYDVYDYRPSKKGSYDYLDESGTETEPEDEDC